MPLTRIVVAPLGCVVIGGLLACATSRQPPRAGGATVGNEDYPAESWQAAASAESQGWSTARVAALKTTVEAFGSSGFMIVTRGRVVAAWGDTGTTRLTHSIRKSFMSALAGMAVAGGKLDTSRTLADLGVGEKSFPLTTVERQARVADLLRARSGVYIPAAGEVDLMRQVRPVRGSHAPGTFWYYNNWDYNALGTIYRQTTGDDIFRAIDERIAKPIGMQEFRVADGEYYFEAGSEHPGYIFRISARDLARFGVLYLNRGRWRGRQLIPESWIAASVRAYSTTELQGLGSTALAGGYGFLWWIGTNAKARPDLGVPDGTFTASGNGGQRLTVIPQLQTVIVNLMNTDVPGPRIGSLEWDVIVAKVLTARLP